MATIRELESGKWQLKCVVEDRSLRPNHSTTTLMPCAGHAGSNRKLTEMFVDRSEAEAQRLRTASTAACRRSLR